MVVIKQLSTNYRSINSNRSIVSVSTLQELFFIAVDNNDGTGKRLTADIVFGITWRNIHETEKLTILDANNIFICVIYRLLASSKINSTMKKMEDYWIIF